MKARQKKPQPPEQANALPTLPALKQSANLEQAFLGISTFASGQLKKQRKLGPIKPLKHFSSMELSLFQQQLIYRAESKILSACAFYKIASFGPSFFSANEHLPDQLQQKKYDYLSKAYHHYAKAIRRLEEANIEIPEKILGDFISLQNQFEVELINKTMETARQLKTIGNDLSGINKWKNNLVAQFKENQDQIPFQQESTADNQSIQDNLDIITLRLAALSLERSHIEKQKNVLSIRLNAYKKQLANLQKMKDIDMISTTQLSKPSVKS